MRSIPTTPRLRDRPTRWWRPGRPTTRASAGSRKALLARGYDIGEADGLIGTSTRKAIQAEQKRLGLTPADGRAGRKILEALKGAQP